MEDIYHHIHLEVHGLNDHLAFAKLQFLRGSIQCILQVLIDCSMIEEDISKQPRYILFSKMIKFVCLKFLESTNSVLQSLMLAVAVEPKRYNLLKAHI